MTGLVLLIPLALGAGFVGLVAFLWSVRSGQYEDLDGAALRILDDEAEAEPAWGPGPETRGGEPRKP